MIAVHINLTHLFNLCTVYVPPKSGDSYFNSTLSFLSDILCSDSPCIIVGDFNFPNICWSTLTGNSPLSSAFCEFIFGWNLTQHVMYPTHIKGNILDYHVTISRFSDLIINPPGPFINLITSLFLLALITILQCPWSYLYNHSQHLDTYICISTLTSVHLIARTSRVHDDEECKAKTYMYMYTCRAVSSFSAKNGHLGGTCDWPSPPLVNSVAKWRLVYICTCTCIFGVHYVNYLYCRGTCCVSV